MEQRALRAQSVSKRQARAQRILDAASVLILRWGYHKVTLDDIARYAGVAKGTLYLHWNTREALLEALLQREREELVKELQRRLHAASAEITLRETVKHLVLALMQRPLLKAVLVRDADLLGDLVRRQQSRAVHSKELAGFAASLASLREQQLIRTDPSLQAQCTLFASVFAGCFLAAPLLPGEFLLPDEELADLMAETVARTLAAGREDLFSHPSPAFARAFLHALEHTAARASEPFSQGESSC